MKTISPQIAQIHAEMIGGHLRHLRMNSRTEHFIVEQSLPGGAAGRFSADKFPAASRGALQRLIEQGHVRVNGKAVKPTHSPRAGERVEIHWPEARPAEAQPEEMPLDILFEDNRCSC